MRTKILALLILLTIYFNNANAQIEIEAGTKT